MNEYGLLKQAKEKKIDGKVGMDENADFDNFTIYEEGNNGCL